MKFKFLQMSRMLLCLFSTLIFSACGMNAGLYESAVYESVTADSTLSDLPNQSVLVNHGTLPPPRPPATKTPSSDSVQAEAPSQSTPASPEAELELPLPPPEPPEPPPLVSPPSLTITPRQAAKDMISPGTLKPTVYYFIVVNEDELQCKRDTWLHGEGGKRLLKVCKRTAFACGLQGTCSVIQDSRTYAYNVIGRFGGQDRFFEIEEEGCRFGYGVRSSCLDPFYTVAADLSIYKPGEVIFVPGVVGAVLPDGSKHSGYFVVRDRGRRIKGRGRFDFFSGFLSWNDSRNPFKRLGLGDVRTNIPYFKVQGPTASSVLTHRAFPRLP